MPDAVGRLLEKPYQRLASSRAIRWAPRSIAFCWAMVGASFRFSTLGYHDSVAAGVGAVGSSANSWAKAEEPGAAIASAEMAASFSPKVRIDFMGRSVSCQD